jgi:two-component system CheB/CheR fusion protein
VNQENRHKVEELAQLSGDLQNVLSSTDIATLFLDRDLRILRFTVKIEDLFNMRQTDRGRPVSDLTHRLGYPALAGDAELVLRRLTPIEREVMDENGRWYLTNLLPYRSADDRIEGVVITFVDITRRKKSEEALARLTKTLEQRVAERSRQVRDLTVSLVRAEQRERRRLSATLHDELQQQLYGVQLKLRLAREAKGVDNGAESDRHLAQAEGMLSNGTRLTRQLSVDLNPPILKNEGLVAILSWLQGHMRELHGLDVRLETDGEVRIDDNDARVLLFQIFRELLFNVAKHSGASSAAVSLRELDGELVIDVRDEGKGFDAEAILSGGLKPESFGLTSVHERIGFLGGSLEVVSKPGEGTTVKARLPRSAKIGN